jgi:hypothetical protein
MHSEYPNYPVGYFLTRCNKSNCYGSATSVTSSPLREKNWISWGTGDTVPKIEMKGNTMSIARTDDKRHKMLASTISS